MRTTNRAARDVDRQRRGLAPFNHQKFLRQRAELLQNTLEEIGGGISVFDRNGCLLAWNACFIELLNLPQDLREGASLIDILRLQTIRGDFGPVDGVQAVTKRFKEFFDNVPMIRERITPTGRILQIQRRALKGGSIITLYADVTEQRTAEAKRTQAWTEAELANRSKSEFLANMSHELRTPLNAIIGFSELMGSGLLDPITDEKSFEYIRDIHSSGLLLLGIVNDLLDMSKIESGKLELAFEEIVVQRTIAEVISMVSELANRRRLGIDLSAPAEDIMIFADERALKQITLNLLSNAIKFSREGEQIRISASIYNKKDLLLVVEDTGIGMSSEELGRALQPFAQAQPTTTREYGGTGLGLPIVKGLVDAHHGKLVIESAPGMGTVVQIALPLHPGPVLV